MVTMVSGMWQPMIIQEILHQEEWVQRNYKYAGYGGMDQTS